MIHTKENLNNTRFSKLQLKQNYKFSLIKQPNLSVRVPAEHADLTFLHIPSLLHATLQLFFQYHILDDDLIRVWLKPLLKCKPT